MINSIFEGLTFLLKVIAKLVTLAFKGTGWYLANMFNVLKDYPTKSSEKVKVEGEIL